MRHQQSRGLRTSHSIMDLRECARQRLPRPLFDFLEGAAETETTARRNITAFDEVQLISRCLVDVASLDTTTRILGEELAWPVMCSATGMSRLFHPEGELGVARAAGATGTVYSVATGSTYTLEAIAATNPAPKVFLLYPFKDRGLLNELMDRAKAAGYRALCLMVDVPDIGKRERDLRSGFVEWPRWPLRSFLSLASHPAWILGQLCSGPVRLANFSDRRMTDALVSQLDSSMTWKSLDAIMSRWSGPFALKGILSVEDARNAADAGVGAIIVSNHGGRQLDGAASPFEVLPEIACAVGDRVELILDGGIRRGVHVVKALALGARACSIGRPYLYGLAAGGEAGVARALGILRAEFELAMRLCGCPSVAHIDERLIRRLK